MRNHRKLFGSFSPLGAKVDAIPFYFIQNFIFHLAQTIILIGMYFRVLPSHLEIDCVINPFILSFHFIYKFNQNTSFPRITILKFYHTANPSQ